VSIKTESAKSGNDSENHLLDYVPVPYHRLLDCQIPMPRIYLVSTYSLCIYSLFDHFHPVCLVFVPRSTGYGPRLLALYRRFFTPITLFSQSRKVILSYLFDLAGFIPYIRLTQLGPPVSELALFSRGQEPDSL
jgi:hypothetical protein